MYSSSFSLIHVLREFMADVYDFLVLSSMDSITMVAALSSDISISPSAVLMPLTAWCDLIVRSIR